MKEISRKLLKVSMPGLWKTDVGVLRFPEVLLSGERGREEKMGEPKHVQREPSTSSSWSMPIAGGKDIQALINKADTGGLRPEKRCI